MLKPLLVLALVAYMVLISPTEGQSHRRETINVFIRGYKSPYYPEKKPKCIKPNEVYVVNPPICSPQTCKSINKTYHCPLTRYHTNTGNGNGACRCKPGYYRNSINQCISKDNCLKCTGPHEYYSCGIACDRTCESLRNQNQSNCRITTFGCVPKCYCDAGYARDDKNICIPINYCEGPTCGINEVFSNCTNGGCGPKTCDGLGMKIGCVKMDPKYCKEGCLCKKGYLRNEDGVCIPKRQCPECGGDPNAVSGCGVNCGQRCSDIGNESAISCIEICYDDACDCKKGFYYDNNIGKCVHPKNCTPICEKNEIFSTCINGGCKAKNCSQLGKPVPCVKLKICHNGCLCKDGYLRADNGTCIPKHQCPKPQCADYETYETCPENSCQPQTCSQLGFPLNCPVNSESDCLGEPECICANENVRDNDGNCIPKDQCPSCGGDSNAVAGCSNYCGKRCSDYKNKETFCPLFCILNGCACKDGFVYDDNLKKCVNPRDCSPTCGINEIFSNCTNGGCGPKTCDGLGMKIGCVKMDPKYCKEGCLCKKGYLRNEDGVCIPKRQCPECGGDPNAVSGCGVNCGQRCSDIGNESAISCIEICYDDACDCKKGFYYDNNIGKCVHPKNCTPICGKNEIFSTCINGGCKAKNCSQLGKPVPCVKLKICHNGCLCKDGYLRADNGTCIPKHQCPKPQCADDETYEICPENSCKPQTCSQLGFPLNCPVNSESDCLGEPECICANENVRDNDGNCISKDQCPSCGGDSNAVAGCSNYCGKRCSDYKNKETLCPLFCILNGCACKDGFVYDDNLKKCVNPRDCISCTKPNEVYDACPPICPPQTCESIGKIYNCPMIPVNNTEHCSGACRCIKGFYRNKNDECISEENCQNCTGPNEYFACGGACDNVCETLSERNQTNCPIRNIKCNPMCYCREGYARDKRDICIPIKNCPAKSCGANQRYVEKPSLVCEPLECSELGFPIDCPPVEDTDCDDEPGCICVDGYVRNDFGRCVQKSQCTSCGGDPNAKAGCGVNCGKTCSTYGKNESCIKICYINACDCKDGFVYDDVVKKCVKYENCSKNISGCDVTNTDAIDRHYRGSIALSGEFIYQLCQSQPDQNFVTSATSILVPLAQIALFAQNVVLKQLLTVLNLNSKDEIKSVYSEETQSYVNQKQVEFELATKYYVNEDYTLDGSFTSESNKYFDAGGENINFGQNKQAAATINKWVANKTRNRIQDLVSADSLDSSTVMVLVNAIYFLGNWVHQFNPNNTQKRDFTKSNNDVIQLDTMYQENTFKYAEVPLQGCNIQALEMPYKNNNFSFLVILPELSSFDDAVLALRNPDDFIDIIKRLTFEKVQVYLPKMKIDTSMDMAEMLQKANVTAMFNPASDGFKGILVNDQPLYITSAVQKAFIKVDETGTEAAAATAIAIGLTSVVEPAQIFVFSADRPYLFYILFNRVPLFCGAYLGP